MRPIKIGTLFALAATSLSAFAQDTQSLTVHSLTAGKYAAVDVNYFGSNHLLYAGPQSASLDGGERFDAYCVDLTHWNSLPTVYPVNVLSTDLLTNGQRIAYLYETYAGTVTNATQGAALQLAIWDVLTDDGDGFTAGNFKSSTGGAILTQANTYLLDSVYMTGEVSWLKAATHGNGGQYQDLVGPAVPGPAAALPFAAWAIALRKRRNRQLKKA